MTGELQRYVYSTHLDAVGPRPGVFRDYVRLDHLIQRAAKLKVKLVWGSQVGVSHAEIKDNLICVGRNCSTAVSLVVGLHELGHVAHRHDFDLDMKDLAGMKPERHAALMRVEQEAFDDGREHCPVRYRPLYDQFEQSVMQGYRAIPVTGLVVGGSLY